MREARGRIPRVLDWDDRLKRKNLASHATPLPRMPPLNIFFTLEKTEYFFEPSWVAIDRNAVFIRIMTGLHLVSLLFERIGDQKGIFGHVFDGQILNKEAVTAIF